MIESGYIYIYSWWCIIRAIAIFLSRQTDYFFGGGPAPSAAPAAPGFWAGFACTLRGAERCVQGWTLGPGGLRAPLLRSWARLWASCTRAARVRACWRLFEADRGLGCLAWAFSRLRNRCRRYRISWVCERWWKSVLNYRMIINLLRIFLFSSPQNQYPSIYQHLSSMANVLPTEEGMLVSGISGTMHSSSKFGLLRQPN